MFEYDVRKICFEMTLSILLDIYSLEFFIRPEVHLYTLLLKGEDLVADAAEVGLEGRE